MEIIELHMLQSFPVSCLNRDDVGAPKSAIFGGAPRARVSSQCWKRAIRLRAQEDREHQGLFRGERSRRWVGELSSRLEDEGAPEASEKANLAIGYLASSEEAAKGSMVYLTPLQLQALANAIAEGRLEFKKGKKVTCSKGKGELKKILDTVADWADIAIFGRMVANDHTLTLEGAGLFSHAISTHRVSNEIDFFTAVDDRPTPEGEDESAGAGHMGTLEFNSACYYRYVGLNLTLLADEDHLGELPPEQRKDVADVFLRATIEAVPVARHNSMFANTLPQYILGLHRSSGQPLSLANAFEKPVLSSDGLVDKSREALEAHYQELKSVYGIAATEHRVPGQPVGDLVTGLTDHVN